MNAPIALFVYNSPQLTQRVIKSLLSCERASASDLYIFSDAAKTFEDQRNVADVRSICRNISGFANVYIEERAENLGFSGNLISGVSYVLSKHSKVIVMEDNLEVSPFFLKYMNSALNFYENYGILSISGYTPPVDMPRGFESSTFIMYRTCRWGWGTWREQWQKIDWSVPTFDAFIRNSAKRKELNNSGNDLCYNLLRWKIGETDDWSIRFTYAGFLLNEPTVFPRKSLVRYIGSNANNVDGACSMPLAANVGLSDFSSGIAPNVEIADEFRRLYALPFLTRVLSSIKYCRYLLFHK